MPCSVVDDLRLALDGALAAKASLGLNFLSVTAVNIVSSGSRPGQGGKDVTLTPIYVGDPSLMLNPTVTTVTSRDVFLSAGRLQDQDIKVGPIARPYSGSCGSGGTDPATFLAQDIAPGKSQQLYFHVSGSGVFTDDRWFKRVNSNEDSNISYTIFLTAVGSKPVLT